MFSKFILLFSLATALMACSQNKQADQPITGANIGILGGNPVVVSDPIAKSTVALRSVRNGSSLSAQCSGTLISKDLILTAAHCVDGQISTSLVVSFGISPATDLKDSLVRNIASFKQNPAYGNQDRFSDVALIKLSQPAPAGYEPVSLLDPSFVLKPGITMTLAGFGATEDVHYTITKELRWVEVPLFENQGAILVTDQTQTKGACAGDSGGPAYFKANNGDWLVYGITRGPTPASYDCHTYGEYTNASFYQTFIVDAAKELGGDQPQFVQP